MTKENTSYPLVSIIMNCHNGQEFLEEAIKSVLSQKYQNWELIFWDNNSKDKSKDIFKKFQDRRLKYYHNNETTTLYKARNLAIEKSEGELLTFLDVDDYWLPERLKFQVDFFLKFPDINFVYGNYYILNEKLKIKKIAFKKKDLITGKIYNSWPLMGTTYFPNDNNFINLLNLNAFNDPSLVQFIHRNLAYIILLFYIFLLIKIYKEQFTHLYKSIKLVGLILIIQIFLGILTLLYGAQIAIASMHQISSIFLVSSCIYFLFINTKFN